MKRKTTLLLFALTGVLLTGGLAAGITYASYAREAAIRQDVGVRRYVFLDASAVIENGVGWDTSNPVMYMYAWQSSQSEYVWIKSGGLYNGKHYFYVPSTYVNCIFVRGNPNYEGDMRWNDPNLGEEDSSNEAYQTRPVWNQTGNLTITSSKNQFVINGWSTGDWSETTIAF